MEIVILDGYTFCYTFRGFLSFNMLLLPMMISSPYATYVMYLFGYCWSPYLYTRIDSNDDTLVRMWEIPR